MKYSIKSSWKVNNIIWGMLVLIENNKKRRRKKRRKRSKTEENFIAFLFSAAKTELMKMYIIFCIYPISIPYTAPINAVHY